MDKIKTPPQSLYEDTLSKAREYYLSPFEADVRPRNIPEWMAQFAFNTAADQSRVIEVMTERIAEAEKVIDAIYDKSSAVYLDEDGVDRTRGNKLALVYRLARNYKAYLAEAKRIMEGKGAV